MISTEIIEKAFEEMIFQEKIFRKLDISCDAVTQVRHKVKTGKHITLDYKIKLLQRAGYRFDYPEYTRKEMAELVKFVLNTSEKAREFGAEYLIDKWRQSRKR